MRATLTSEDFEPREGLFGYCPDEIEQIALEAATDALYDCGYSDSDFELLAARVIGSRMTADLYRETSDIDVLLMYEGRIRDDDMFSIVNDHPAWIEDAQLDIFPEKERSLEYMLDQDQDHQESKK